MKPAVDAGGPLRKYFHHLVQELSRDNSLLCGPQNARVLRHSVIELERKSCFFMLELYLLLVCCMEVLPLSFFLLLWLTILLLELKELSISWRMFQISYKKVIGKG